MAAFEDPDLCILDRSPNEHLAFGHGIHKCLGAPLARLEMRIALEELLARTASLELDSTAVHVQNELFTGCEALPVRCWAA